MPAACSLHMTGPILLQHGLNMPLRSAHWEAGKLRSGTNMCVASLFPTGQVPHTVEDRVHRDAAAGGARAGAADHGAHGRPLCVAGVRAVQARPCGVRASAHAGELVVNMCQSRSNLCSSAFLCSCSCCVNSTVTHKFSLSAGRAAAGAEVADTAGAAGPCELCDSRHRPVHLPQHVRGSVCTNQLCCCHDNSAMALQHD